jgi:two-component system sensor histidine kinase MtrB
VVPRPTSSAPRPDSNSAGNRPGGETMSRPDVAGSQESYEQQGEAFRGR